MADWPEIFVLRHGQTKWNAAGRYQGQQDSPLTEIGIEHAKTQAGILESAFLNTDKCELFSSPLGRARQTAGYALAHFHRPFQVDLRLAEVSFGLWEGKTNAEIDADFPGNRIVTNEFDWNFTSPGGERFKDVVARVTEFLDDLTRPSVIVTHGISGRVLRGVWLGLDHLGMSVLEGGQGNVFHLRNGAMRNLTE